MSTRHPSQTRSPARSPFFNWLAAGVVSACVALAAPALAAPLVVFGDSLSDSGNVTAAGFYDPGQVVSGNSYVPAGTYASGVFSNGPVWVNGFAAAMGWSIDASHDNPAGTNFAYGGARLTPSVAAAPPSLFEQTQQYLGRVSGVADPEALYVIAGGGNDARDALENYGAAYFAALATGSADPHGDALAASLPAALQNYVLGMSIIIESLRDAGAARLLVWNMPYLGSVPALQAGGLGAVAEGFAQAFNTALGQLLAAMPTVQLFDLHALGVDFAEDRADFGLTNVSDACGAVPGADCSTWLWWDGIHPTTAGHQLIASAMVRAVADVNEVAEPPVLLLVLGGLLLVGAAAQRRTGRAHRRTAFT